MDDEIVYSSEHGDLRKKNKTKKSGDADVDEAKVSLYIRRLTSGKGRTIIEISNLPQNKKWNQKLAKDLKKKLGVGGAFKENYVEVHGEKLDQVIEILDLKKLKWKKTGG